MLRTLCNLSTLRLLVFLCFLSPAGAQALLPVPPLTARVIDQTATLSPEQRGRLEAKLAAFEAQKGAQIALLLVASVQPEAIEQYALRVVEAWKLGRKGIDDGALLLIAKDDKKLRIEVGYGLEGVLNDATAKRIISETITPRFKQGDFYAGIDAGLDRMIRVVAGEALPPPQAAADSGLGGDRFEYLLIAGFAVIFVVGGFLRALFGRLLAAGIIGGAAGVIAAFLISSFVLALLIGIVVFILSLLFGHSGGGRSSGGHSWGGGSGGSGSSGGFSGGGGSFGGGGASGDW